MTEFKYIPVDDLRKWWSSVRPGLEKIKTKSPENWIVRKESEAFGCDEPESILKVGNTIYFAKNKKYYRWIYCRFTKQSSGIT